MLPLTRWRIAPACLRRLRHERKPLRARPGTAKAYACPAHQQGQGGLAAHSFPGGGTGKGMVPPSAKMPRPEQGQPEDSI